MKKKLIRKVELEFFRDDATGQWGLAHKNTIKNNNGGEGFNAFWDGHGLFHDVAEHAHEFSEYFQNDAAMNIGGEMAAMGAFYYFVEELGLSARLLSRHIGGSEVSLRITFDMVEDAVRYGNSNFGDSLISQVPPQPAIEESYIEDMIQEYCEKVNELQISDEEDIRECARFFADSLASDKIANLHRWGYREAEKFIPNSYYNMEEATAFIRYWSDFCKNNKAEEIAQYHSGINFFFFLNERDEWSWIAVFKRSVDAVEINKTLIEQGEKPMPFHPTIFSGDI